MTLGLLAGVLQSKTPPTSTPKTHKHPENEVFDTFAQLSSPLQPHSPKRLPASPALEGLMRQNGHSGLSAAVEMFERAQGYKPNQRLPLPSRQRSPTHRPLSNSSGSSQEVVEQHLTQEDDMESLPQPLLPSELQIDNELVDAELRWPTDDESDMVATEGNQNSEQNDRLDSSRDSARGRNFRCGSLNVPLGANSQSASSPHSQIWPIVLQTQAPYSSQVTGWSQSQ